MKKCVALLLAVLVLTMFSIASARPVDRHERQERYERHDRRERHNWSHSSYKNTNWRHSAHRGSLPFKWYEKRSRFSTPGYRLDPIHDRAWNDRFPGLHAYRWNDAPNRGFWYRGHRITNAVMFYDHADELVSVGFMHNGTFIFIRDDDNSYENRDSFFLAWWRH